MSITKIAATNLYKVTGPNGESIHGGSFTYPLPTETEPGEWTPDVNVSICDSGYHLTSEIGMWMKVGCRIFEAEGRGEFSTQEDKTAFSSARLVREVAPPEWWTNAMEVVAEVKGFPYLDPQGDPDPEWKVFDTRAAARAAARDAAWAAARDAAGDAARAAARAAAWAAARAAAWAAAWDAAWAAAWAAAGAAARDASLWAQTTIVSDLIDTEHLDHVSKRIDVWRRGYGLLCDVGGVLYVYRSIA